MTVENKSSISCEEQIAHIYADNFRVMARYVLAHGKNGLHEGLEPEDIVQSAVLSVIKKNPAEVNRSYIFTSVHNLMKNEGRNRRRHYQAGYVDHSDIQENEAEEANPAKNVGLSLQAEVENKLKFEELLLAMDKVSPQYHTVLRLAGDGLSMEEISRKLGEPVTTIKSRLNRARTALKEVLLENPRSRDLFV